MSLRLVVIVMLRDLKLSFDILVYIEQTDTFFGPSFDELRAEMIVARRVAGDPAAEMDLTDSLSYHIRLLEQRGFVVSKQENEHAGRSPDDDVDESTIYYQLTWLGHDYLDGSRSVVPFAPKQTQGREE
ncbi:DUF2513 domain-containing protein [Pseudomonas graminis]|uniref:DUF2513 domain-containing protein n=1 Tax=Pseudomonas graminis TaxID=158627 RepID=UPI003C1561FE